MGNHHLVEFEEIVLITVDILNDEAYGIDIINEMETLLNRKVSIGALQTVLRRLEKKSFLTSKFGEKTKMRGGKRKRFFSLTPYSKKVLTEVKEQRMGLWSDIPEFAFSS